MQLRKCPANFATLCTVEHNEYLEFEKEFLFEIRMTCKERTVKLEISEDYVGNEWRNDYVSGRVNN